jgi:hypothetical protein
VKIDMGNPVRRPNARLWQTVTLTNSGASPLPGPVWLVLDGLNSSPPPKPVPPPIPKVRRGHIRLLNAAGFTTVLPPLGNPYVEMMLTTWSPGQRVTVVLKFADPTGGALTYRPRVLVGPGMP